MRFLNFLISRAFAVFLLGVSAGLLIFWNRYPDFYSPLFLIIPVFLFFSISLCIVNRITASRQRWNIGFLGSVAFHIGMLIVILSTSLGALTRFFAVVALPQGVLVSLDNKDFSTIYEQHFGMRENPVINLKLNAFETKYAGEQFPVEYIAGVDIGILRDDGYYSFKDKIEVNQPIHYDGYSFLLERGGYSPRFILKDKDGNIMFNGFINLANRIKSEDVFYMKEANFTLYTRFFPDMYREGNKVGSRSPVLKNPAFGIRIVQRDNPFKDMWRGALKKGEVAQLGGMTLEFADLKPYVVIQVVKDPTYWGIFAGWVLIVAGLLLRYIPIIKQPQAASIIGKDSDNPQLNVNN